MGNTIAPGVPAAPKQARSKQTREKIIQAAIRLFQERGYEKTTSNEIASAAGVSVGSGIAILLGLDHPEMFRALILVGGSSGPGGSIEERIDGYTRVGVSTYHLRHLRDLVAPDFADSKLGKYLLDTFVERDPWLSGESIGQIFRARGALDMTPRLATMKVPTLVVNGEYDNSLAGGKKTASLIPRAAHRILPRTGHACNIEDPAGFDQLVIDFLRAHGLMPAAPS